ncbi:putative membrane-associated protein [Desulfosporosinus orientis DSM 765]|uniref:Putative membrane-associated protein n=1 Tax=Desulfosporosinus orientis (strain ATCC 19365 / DSM 765 / NCIMB 8382 / VKM B-1628 / Singapore I) TaxID=768706 RepID=G7WDV2_DESOD|nr:DedA family protein [Desulfosporosinus orientis]AET68859.1 putative membrane-associated protein [Desulfosporosinus orientis DSM 765]
MQGLELYLIDFIYHFRYVGLLILLTCGLIGVPVPDEFLMTFSGFQTSLGRMDFGKTLIVAALGSFLGMNLSYWIGRRLGIPFLHKVAPYLHLNEKKIAQAEQWFQCYGDRLIVIGYFFPGFRHFTAYFSGMSKLHYGRYSMLAGIGALLWSVTFISLGRVLGEHWQKITHILHNYLARSGVVLAILVFLVYLYSSKRGKTSRVN